MKNKHLFRSNVHLLLVEDIEILHAEIIFLVEEAFLLNTCHVEDIQIFHGLLIQLDNFFKWNLLRSHGFANITWYAQFLR